MHELGITQEIVAIVAQRLPGARVRRLVVEVGQLSAILPDSLRFCFEICARGTELDGAELDIREIPGSARCRACATEFTLEQPYGCCACGNSDLDWIAGQELKITEVELR